MAYVALYRQWRPQDFDALVGQKAVKTTLKNALASGKIAHAYLFSGPRGTGKTSMARILAKSLNCEQGPTAEPCGQCGNCQRIVQGTSLDVIEIDAASNTSVDNIRDLREQVAFTPAESRYKVYIIDEVHMLSTGAFNALLKTLEEPPEYAVILILTTNVGALLPTILSRCVILSMKPARDEQVKKYLMQSMEIPDYKADICVAFARGNVGKAKILAGSEEFDKVKEEAVSLLKSIKDMEINEVVSAIKRINEYKLDVNDYLDIFSVWYRDVLLFKATHDANHLIFKEEIQYIRRVADKSTYEGIETIIDGLDKAKQRLTANVNFDLTMELLLMTIKEN